MKVQLPLLMLATTLCAGNLFSQEANEAEKKVHRCSTTEYMNEMLANDPEWAARIEQLNEEFKTYNPAPGERAVLRIPVVFHVVYQNATENISSSRLTDQLAVLNKDYRKTNTDTNLIPAPWKSIAADTEIEFCLATVDNLGQPTTGINRVETTVSSFNTNNNVKFSSSGGADAWPRDKYLNIWVCDLGSSLLGYAQFPGGASSTDGVVLHYKYTGTVGSTAPYNKGRTGTHEVGHWLGLFHIWGDSPGCSPDDGISDTPLQAEETYGCPTWPLTDACSTTSPGIMFMNYMDYTNDACMYMFTVGQKNRMTQIMNSSSGRLALKNGLWQGCGTVSAPELPSFGQYINIYPNPSAGEVNVMVDLIYPDGIKVNVYNMLGACVKQAGFDETSTNVLAIDLSELPNGVYVVDVIKGDEKTTKKVVLNR
jgi:hypothetical protein